MMQPSSNQDYYIVTGISSKVVVESIHFIAHLPIANKAREILSKEIRHETVPIRDGFLGQKRTNNNLGEKGIKLQEIDKTHEKTVFDCDPDPAETRMQLRAKRKQCIQKHLSLKPSMDSELSYVESHLGIQTDNDITENEMFSLSCIAKQILVLEDELLTLQSGFNRQLLNAAQRKISTRDNVVLRNQRIQEISRLLKDEGVATSINEEVSFSPGEFYARPCNQPTNIHAARDLFLRGSIHEFEFLLHGDVDLSPAAEAFKEEAKVALKRERDQLSEEIRTIIDDFDKLISSLRKMELDVTMKLKLGEMKLDLKAQQMEIVFVDDSTIEQSHLGHTKLNKLKAIKCVMPIQILNMQLSEVTNVNRPVLYPKKSQEKLICDSVELSRILGIHKHQVSHLRRQNKKLSRSIRQLKTELVQHRNKCKELQVQKLGRPVDSSILDISPIAQSDCANEMNMVQNIKSYHQHDLQTANRERDLLKHKLLLVTNKNTSFLNELSSLKQQEIKIHEDIKRVTSSNCKDKVLLKHGNMDDQERFRRLLSQQKHEIDHLRHEIQSLKTKCGT